MKTIYQWDSEAESIKTQTVETKSVRDVCLVLAKHGPGEIADKFIAMCCIATGHEQTEAEWYRIHQAIQAEADQEEPDAEYLEQLTQQREELEADYPWLPGYRGEEADEPPAPTYADADAFIAAHWRELRAAAYGDMGKQMGMQHDDARDGTTTWVDHCAAVKAAFPKPE